MIIKKAEYIISATDPKNYPHLNLPEFIFMGRSNVGKSNLLNALTNRKKLAYTSSKPGKTTTLNFYNINDEMVFIDVPGYGYAERQKYDRMAYGKMIEKYLHFSTNLKTCFLVVDIRHKPSEDDVLMYNYLNHFEKEIVIIATKIDKISKSMVNNNLQIIKNTFGINNEVKIYPVSSLNKIGIEDVLTFITNKIIKTA